MKKNIFFIFLLLISIAGASQEKCANNIDDDGDGLKDCLDPDCKSNNVPTGALFNTGTNGSGGVLPGGSNDLHWKVSTTTMAGPYSPAVVMTNIPPVYYNSPWPDCDWISFDAIGLHPEPQDFYFKIEFELPCYNICGVPYSTTGLFCLNMDFFADNSVDAVYVNGILQTGLPGIPASDPYNNIGYSATGKKTLSLCKDWKAGTNTLVIKIASGDPYVGFLAQNSTSTPPPVIVDPTITSVPPLCVDGSPVTVTAASTGGTWSASCGSCINAATGVFNPATAGVGTHTITYVTNPCTSIDTALVYVHPAPAATINPVTAKCVNSGIFNLTAVNSGGTWSGTGITNSNTGTFNPAVSGPGTFTITYTIPGICSRSATTNVTILSAPTAAISSIPSICDGQSTTLTASGGGTYSWSTGMTSSSISVLPSTTTTYSVIVTNGSGCKDTALATLQVLPTPIAAISGTDTICTGQTTILTATGGGTYAWSNAATSSSITVSPVSSATYSVIVTNSSGCKDTALSYVHVMQTPDATINAVSPHCANAGPFNLSSVMSGGVWTGTGITNSITGTFDPAISGPGTFTITYTISGPCSDTATQTITILPSPIVAIAGTDSICTGQTTTLTASGGGTYVWSNSATTSSITISPTSSTTYSVIVTNSSGCSDTANAYVFVQQTPDATINAVSPHCANTGPFNLSSLMPGGVWSGTGITNSTIGTFDPAVSGPGTFTITYTISGPCSDTATKTITILPAPIAIISGNDTICAGQSTTLTASGGSTYQWSNSATTDSIVISPSSSTTYTVIASNAQGCSDTTSVNVQVNPVPVPNITAPSLICYNDVATLMATGGGTYVWNTGDTTQTITNTLTNTTTYIVTVTNVYGCSASDTVVITVNPSPIASFTANPYTGYAPLTVNFTNTSQNANTYYWTFGDGNTSSITNPSHIYSSNGTYIVTLIASLNNQCPDTAKATIVVLQSFGVLIPNVFTPNNDGNNDVFFINAEGVKDLEGEIYDRWGLKMYAWDTVKGGWDGYTTSGQAASDGTYFYILKLTELSGKTHIAKGAFTLLR